MTKSQVEFYARATVQELVPLSELLALSGRALEGILAQLCVAVTEQPSEEQAALVRTAALDVAVTAVHIVAGAEKLLLLAKLSGTPGRSDHPP
jgi:uncharacterized protein YgbK (DUF1537 family)